MSNSHDIRATGAALGFVVMFFCGCLPLKNLDKAVGGRSGTASEASGGSTVGDGGPPTSSGGMGGLSASDAASGGAAVDAADPVDASTSQGGASAGASGGTTVGDASPGSATGGTGGETIPSTVGSAGIPSSSTGSAIGGMDGGVAGGTGGTAGMGGTVSSGTFAPALPDIVNSPVQGQITYSAGASWDIDGQQVPAFEIHTPTANYWLVKSAAAIVSITDTTGVQWINFSSGFRPDRGVPNLGGCCQPGDPEKLGLPVMTTEIDPSFTVTSTHLRLISTSDTGSYRIVWDFFLSHFTLTVDRAEKPFVFTYRGVPGGAINAADRLVLSSGETLSPSAPYSGALSGPEPWVTYKHPLSKHALFLIQHTSDALTDSYQVADGDTPMWTFGGDQSKRTLTQTPIRFSLGLMNSVDDAVVTERIRFVVSAID
jgi:hypothetical protein